MTDITTPVLARKTEEFTTTQIDLVKRSLAIADNPVLADRTYIIFDAISGNNNLHIDVGGSTSYTIDKGEGGLASNFTDTGGTKVLSYTNTGRYLITIIGPFHGINTDGKIQADKDQYVSILAGTNYPAIIPIRAFEDCVNLQFFEANTITSVGGNSFDSCASLIYARMPNVTIFTFGADFPNCVNLIEAIYPLCTSIGGVSVGSFDGCLKLRDIHLPLVTGLNLSDFRNCKSLESIYFPSVASMGSSFDECDNLQTAIFPVCTNIDGFTDCPNLQKAIFPIATDIVTTAFSGNTSLKTLELGIVTSIGTNAFLNVILTDLFVNGTEAQARTIRDDIITNGGFFTSNSRFIFGSEDKWIIDKSITTGNILELLSQGSLRFSFEAGGTGGFFLKNGSGVIVTPSNGGVFYVVGGALFYRGSGGTQTAIAPA